MNTDEPRWWQEAERRDAELSSGKVAGRTHKQVMLAARKALRGVVRGQFTVHGDISKPTLKNSAWKPSL